jgi:hypothetical protein
MCVYYWPEMDQLVIVYDNGTVEVSAGKYPWYTSIFPMSLYWDMSFKGELIYEG